MATILRVIVRVKTQVAKKMNMFFEVRGGWDGWMASSGCTLNPCLSFLSGGSFWYKRPLFLLVGLASRLHPSKDSEREAHFTQMLPSWHPRNLCAVHLIGMLPDNAVRSFPSCFQVRSIHPYRQDMLPESWYLLYMCGCAVLHKNHQTPRSIMNLAERPHPDF